MIPISLILKNISKYFYEKKLFDNISFEFKIGSYALLGKNGIGKSTLLSIMAGSIVPDGGTVTINQVDLFKKSVIAKRNIAYIPDKSLFYPFIKGEEFLKFICAVKKASFTTETKKLISDFNLNTYMNTPFSDMSLGTQKKFMIVAATISDPPILIMDEPTNGLENSSYDIFINYLLSNINRKIIILATHEKEIIEKFNVKILMLDNPPVKEFKLLSE